MSERADAPVLICGAGPVGMLVALELSAHGVSSTLIERNPSTTTFPKMDLTNARSMELLDRFGLVDAVRAAGVEPSFPFEVVFCSSLGGHEVGRWELPSVEQMEARIAAADDGSAPKVAWQRISQEQLEPVLMERCLADPLIEVLRPWRLLALDQDGDGVSVTLESSQAPGEQKVLRGNYLVACDGANSTVRAILEIDQQGERDVATFAQVHFRSRDLDTLQRFGQFWHLFFVGGGVGAIIAQDERETWTLHTTDLDPETERGEIDPQALLNRICGCEIEVDEFLEVSLWRPNILVADRFRSGRVFLAGDAAHQVIPTGGYGLNTGIGDAIDLGWKLAAVVSGWGGEALLESYEAERRPVAIANRDWSFRHVGVHMEAQELVDESLLDDEGPAGEAHRKQIAEFLEENRGENESFGIELGYTYADSPVVASEDGPASAGDPFRYEPSTRPGARAPHVVLADGRSPLDHFVDGFTLVDFSAGGDDVAAPLTEAASALGIPLAVLRLDDAAAREVYEQDLVLVRPDGHVAWRGEETPADAEALLRRVSGQSHT